MSQQDKFAEGFMLRATEDAGDGTHSDTALGVFARKIYALRREREKRLPVSGLFQDPAWDILLDLFISYSENSYVSVTSAGLAAQVPTTTALRWLWALEEEKLIERKQDKVDKRRNFVFLTIKGQTYMREILNDIRIQLQSDSVNPSAE